MSTGFLILGPVNLTDLVAETLAKAKALGPRHWVIEEVVETPRPWSCSINICRVDADAFKVRTRTYLDAGECMLEVKTKGAV